MCLEEPKVSERNFKLLCEQDICDAIVPIIVQRLVSLQFRININCAPEVSLANSSILHVSVQYIPIFSTPTLSIKVDNVVYTQSMK
jgi:hypothetical protein